MDQPRSMKVAIIDDDATLRASVACLIDLTDGFECRAQFGSMEDALAARSRRSTSSCSTSGCRVCRASRARAAEGLPRNCHPRADDLRRRRADLRRALRRRIGYVLKDTPPDAARRDSRDRSRRLGHVALGGAKVVTLFRAAPPPARADYGLTPRESKLLALLVEGHSYRGAGVALGVSLNTIPFHMRHIYDKLQVHSNRKPWPKRCGDGWFADALAGARLRVGTAPSSNVDGQPHVRALPRFGGDGEAPLQSRHARPEISNAVALVSRVWIEPAPIIPDVQGELPPPQVDHHSGAPTVRVLP